jgi:CHAD domain-containing protein
LDYLSDVRRAAKRLRSGDPERLHDFRVALRRLRTLVRVYREYFDKSVRKKHRRRLREFGRNSSPRRDAQAQLALLNELSGDSAWPGATARVCKRLEKRVTQSQHVPATLVKEFRKVERRLRRRLRSYREQVDPDEPAEPVTFRSVALPAAAQLGDELSVALAAIRSPADAPALHAARLSAKRLRYTLEAFRPVSPLIAAAVLALTRLQDLLGDARDSARLREIVLEERERADESMAAEFDALTDALHQQAANHYAELERLWLNGNSQAFFHRLVNALTAISPVAARP